MLKQMSNYLSKTLRPAKITFNRTRLFEKKYQEYGIDYQIHNPLFQMRYFENSNIIIFDHYNLPNISIAEYIIPPNFGYNIENENKDFVSFSTNGLIPTRWLYMIKDFHWEESDIELLPEINFEEKLKEIPEITFKKILSESRKKNSSMSFQVINDDKGNWYRNNKTYPDEYWATFDGKFTPYTEKVLEECKNFESLKSNNFPYRTLFACEGGIEIFTDEQKTYLDFTHSFPFAGSIRNEIKGKNKYRTGKDVNCEELTCLFLALKKLGVNVETY